MYFRISNRSGDSRDCSPCYCLDPWGKLGSGVRVCETGVIIVIVSTSWLHEFVWRGYTLFMMPWIIVESSKLYYRSTGRTWSFAIRVTFVRPRLDLCFTTSRDDKADCFRRKSQCLPDCHCDEKSLLQSIRFEHAQNTISLHWEYDHSYLLCSLW